MTTEPPCGPCHEPARVIDADKRQSRVLAPATRRSHSFAGEDRSDRMGDATWGGKAIPLRKRACWTGEGGERREAGWQALRAGVRQLLAPNQVGMGRERAEGRVEERERESGLHDSMYCTSWYSVQSQRRYIHVHKHTLPDYARRGSHVQVQLSQPPAPRALVIIRPC